MPGYLQNRTFCVIICCQVKPRAQTTKCPCGKVQLCSYAFPGQLSWFQWPIVLASNVYTHAHQISH